MPYEKLSARLVVSANSDYSDPLVDSGNMEISYEPDESLIFDGELSTTAMTLDLGTFTTVKRIVVINESATAAEVVKATWYYQRGTQGPGSISFGDDDPDNISDAEANGTFGTNGAVTLGYVRVTNATLAGNDGCYLVAVASADNLELATTESITTSLADPTATLSFERKNTQGIAAGGSLVVPGAVTAGDLALVAESGTPRVRVYVTGD